VLVAAAPAAVAPPGLDPPEPAAREPVADAGPATLPAAVPPEEADAAAPPVATLVAAAPAAAVPLPAVTLVSVAAPGTLPGPAVAAWESTTCLKALLVASSRACSSREPQPVSASASAAPAATSARREGRQGPVPTDRLVFGCIPTPKAVSLAGFRRPHPASAGLLRSVGLRPPPAVSGERLT